MIDARVTPAAEPMRDTVPAARRWLPLALALVGALALQLWLLAALDLRDLPGPAGILLVRDLQTGSRVLGWPARLGSPLLLLTDPLLAARAWCSLCGLAAMAGVSMAAGAVGGRRAAAWGALLAAVWTPAAHQAWMIGPGIVAWGLAWLGTGACWLGCRRGSTGLATIGAFVAVLGMACKASALPLAAMLPLGILLVPRRQRGPLAGWVAVAVAMAAGLAWTGLPAREPYLAGAPPSGAQGGAGLLPGLAAILHLPQRGLAQGAFPWLAGLAGLCALPLGTRRLLRALCWLISVALLLALARSLGESTAPRYLLAPSMGLLVLLATGPGQLARRAWPRRIGVLAAAVVVLSMLADTLAFAEAWAAQRQPLLGTEAAALPAMPAALRARHANLSRGMLMESSEPGILELVELCTAAPEEGVVTVRLRDRREIHGQVAATAAQRPHLLLDHRRCCPHGRLSDSCAQATVARFQDSGAILLLPRRMEGLEPDHKAWVEALVEAAEAAGSPEHDSSWWRSWRAQRTGGPLPCSPREDAR